MNSSNSEKRQNPPPHVTVSNLAKDSGSSSNSLKVQPSPVISPPLNLNPALYSNFKSPIHNTSLSPSCYINPSLISLSSPSPNTNYQASSISKSLSNLDVKQMTRDISHLPDVTPQEDMWPILVVYVLPLFNGERLCESIESLNEMVRTCLRQTDLASFADSIQNDLLDTGMFNLNTKLSGVTEEKLVTRIIELWSFFLGIVLPYLEGVFLPHQLALKEVKRAKHLHPVRTIALNMFKNKIILPLLAKLEAAFRQLVDSESAINRADAVARILQMMLLLDKTPGSQDELFKENDFTGQNDFGSKIYQYQRITKLLQEHCQQNKNMKDAWRSFA